MYCKHCGNVIDDDSRFCRFCGKLQNSSEENHTNLLSDTTMPSDTTVKLDIDGDIKATLVPQMPTFPTLTQFISYHAIFFIVAFFWIFLNVIFLSAGEDRDGFWPNYDTYHSWDLKYYGLTEFLVYAILVPVIGFIIYNEVRKYMIQQRINASKMIKNIDYLTKSPYEDDRF